MQGDQTAKFTEKTKIRNKKMQTGALIIMMGSVIIELPS
jgi:hypothetical protein